ncbi:MAG: extracellular solute-binding protein, partial [Caldilinea sp.]
GQPHSRTSLALLLWGDLTDAAARGNLRKALATLRQSLGSLISTERDYVSLALEQVHCDVRAFEQHAQESVHAGNAAQMNAAIALYRGDFLSGFVVRNAPDFDLWLYHTQERLRGAAVRILTELAQLHRQQGASADELACLQHILTLEPWREETHRQLMLTLANAGERSAALRQYELCVASLAAELGVEPGAETTGLYQQIRAGSFIATQPIPSPVSITASDSRTGAPLEPHLPAELTPIVGRDQELTELTDLLTKSDCRLVSMVGPGGIGKTRLALALAHRLQGEFSAVALASLASLEQARAIPAVAAAAFGLIIPPESDPDAALQRLHGRVLLVLDNFEHLLPDGAGVIEAMLSANPGLVCVVTTREALSVPWEWRYDVQELAYPLSLDDVRLGDYGAVQLFLQLARRTRPRYPLQRAEMPHVVRICQLVGGMPLGIEFAAAQLGRLPCELIAHELVAGLDRLEAVAPQHLPARQRSLQASFEASWRTLAPEEQRVLAVLSILRGEFTLEAAQAIADATSVSITRLVDKSLIRLASVDRYALHEVIRRLAEQKLTATPGAAQAAFVRYRDYYATLAQGTRREIFLRLTNTPDLRGYFQSLRGHLHHIWQQTASQPDAVAIENALNAAEMRLRTFEFGFIHDWPALQPPQTPEEQEAPAVRQDVELIHSLGEEQSNATPLEAMARQDVVPLDVIWLPEMAAEVADLTGALAEERAQLLPKLVASCSVDGRFLGMPHMLNIGVLYYRRDLLERYGYGGPPRTWAELEQMAAEIQAQERAAGARDFWGYLWQGYCAEHLTCNALEWQHAEGGGLILAAGGQATVNNAQTIRALERARRWIGAISPPHVRMTDELATEQAWRAGKAAFMRLWSIGHPILETPGIGDLTGVTVLPRGAACHAGTLGIWPLTVRLNTHALTDAVRLIRETCSLSAQRAHALSKHPIPPALRALYDDPTVQAHSPLYREVLTLVEHDGLAIRPAQIARARYPQVSNAYATAVAHILYEGADAAATLANLEQTLHALLNGGER